MGASTVLKQGSVVFIYGAPILLGLAIIAVMNTTNPLTVGPAGILMLLVLLYAGIVAFLNACITAGLSIIDKLYGVAPIHRRRMRYMTTILGFAPVLLIALNSIGQASGTDVILVLLFTTLGCFYIVRRVSESAKPTAAL